MKWLKNNSQQLSGYGIPIMYTLFAVVFFILSAYTQIWEVRVALLISASGLVISAMTNFVKTSDDVRNNDKHQEIITKLEELKQEIGNLKQPKSSGVVIADVISSGLKYYAEHMAEPKKEKKDD
jgi:hypothetical protein